MKKGYLIAGLGSALVMALALFLLVILPQHNNNQELAKKANATEELAELVRQETENNYEQFQQMYSERMSQITNDSLIAQLTQEQMRYQQLLEELKQVKADDAAEIARLRRELSSVRSVLRSYIRQVDSLNQVNATLRNENSQLTGQLAQSHQQNLSLLQQRDELTEQVTIAAQLNATAIQMTALNKRNKAVRKMKDAKTLQVNFNISRNVTAENGARTIYIRIQKPTGEVLSGGGSFAYENRQLEYSMKKVIEYSGEETSVVVYWQVDEYLDAGDYIVSIFADGSLIGSQTFNFDK